MNDASHAQGNPALFKTALTIFSISVVAMCIVYGLLGRPDGFVYIWPLTAIQLGFLLPRWEDGWRRFALQAAGTTGVILGGCIMRLPFWFAFAIAAIGFVDVWIAGTIMKRGVRSFEDLKRRENLILFAIASIVGPATAGLLAGIPVSIFLHQLQLRTAMSSALSDSLGIAVVLPPVLFALTGEYRRFGKIAPHLKRSAPALVMFCVAACAVFAQTRFPLLFMVFPAMTLLLLAMGLEGAVVVAGILAIVGCFATAHGYGPLWLLSSNDAGIRTLLLQVFLWLSIATALPIGALLDERRRSEEAAEAARRIYQTLLKHADDMIILSSMDGNQRYISAACERLTGWTPEEFMELERLTTFHPDDREMATLVMESMAKGKSEHTFRYRIAHKSGGWRWVEATARTFLDDATGGIGGYVGTIRDIEEIKQSESTWTQEKEALTELVRTDALTGVSNRRAFDEAMSNRMLHTRRTPGQDALMMIDVDYFKKYNDLYGHPAGDECLKQIAQVLKSCANRNEDMVARWGGEEFAVLLPVADVDGARTVATAMLEQVRRLNVEHKGNPKHVVTISIGIALATPESAANPSLWIQKADRALYLSKSSGRDRLTVNGNVPELLEHKAG